MEGDESVSMRRFLRVRSVGGQMLKEAVKYFSEAAAVLSCDGSVPAMAMAVGEDLGFGLHTVTYLQLGW